MVGCYSPNPVIGIPCSPSLECPAGQQCDVAAAGGPTCVGEPSGPDGGKTDDPLPGAPANDRPGGAVDVSGGGTFAWDLRSATDDVAVPCATEPGPDVFFTLTLDAPEVIYADTFGSTGNPVIAVLPGPCAAPGAMVACVDDSCGDTQAQGAWSLPAGEHCVVLDHVGPATDASGMLRVVRGGRAGDPLGSDASGTVSGDTCMDDNSNDASCGCESAPDHHYFFTLCPGSVSATLETCNGASWDTVVQLRDGAYSSMRCNDDACGDLQSRASTTLDGPGVFWAIIDGCDECGAYTLSYTLTPN